MTIRSAIPMVLIFFFSVLQMDCKTDPPLVPPIEVPPYQQSIFLSVADSGLTEVYLTLTMTDTLPPRGFEIFRNNSKILSGSLFGKETTLVDTTALFNTSYTYQSYRIDGALRIDSSTVVMTKTFDTTSHEFVWTENRFGEGNPSVLYDISILNDSILYACGEISYIDSAGNTANQPYNFAESVSNQWRFSTTKDVGYLYGNLYSILTFTTNDIWVGSTIPEHWNGIGWKFWGVARGFPNAYYIKRIFGINTQNILFVGSEGNIVKYNGNNWQKMVSGTTVDLTDIWGTPDGSTVWACGYQSNFTSSVLLQYSKQTDTWQTLWTKGGALTYPFDIVGSIWGNRKLYVASGAEVYELNGSAIKKHSPWFQNFIYHIRGNGENDIVAVTGGGGIWHYNGSNWEKIYSNAQRSLYSVAIKNNMIVAVGIDESSFPEKAFIVVGKR